MVPCWPLVTEVDEGSLAVLLNSVWNSPFAEWEDGASVLAFGGVIARFGELTAVRSPVSYNRFTEAAT
jgi:hypothetical protein